jgi:Methyltransferase domain
MTLTGHRALYHRVRGRVGTWRRLQYQRWSPKLVAKGAEMGGTTAALLEYPFEPQARWGWGKPPHPLVAAILAEGVDRYAQTAKELHDHLPNLSKIPRDPEPGRPCWVNGYWTGLDAVLQYAAIADRRPTTYIEIGSGNSTLFARQAIVDHGLSTKIVSVDPNPRADVDASCDSMYRVPLEQMDLSVFDQLRSGDVMLLDGTHTVFMSSDAVVAVLDILPRLRSGVLVGIHDVFLPWDYPPEWARRWYGEHFLLAAMLLAGARDWTVTFPTWHVCKETSIADSLDAVWEVIGDPPGRTGSSLWLERS